MSLVAAAMLCVVVVGASPSASELVGQGNRLLAEGKAKEALEAYKQAELAAPESPYVWYDEAMAHYKLGELDEARRLFEKALSSEDEVLVRGSRHGLGTCDHAEALEKLSSLEEAIGLLEGAMMHYQSVLAEDPQNGPARDGMHKAGLLWRSLRDKLKKQQQGQKKKQHDKQQQRPQSQASSRPQSQSQPSRQPQTRKAGQQQPQSRPQAQRGRRDRRSLSQKEARQRLRAMMDRQKRRKRGRRATRMPMEQPEGVMKDW